MQIPAIQGSLAGVSPAASVTGLGDVGSVGTLGSSGSAGSGGFGSMLTNAISSLNQTQNTASSDSVALATGQASDVTQVVTDVEKANLEMQLAVQVRNKAVDAYQEIMRMQI
jgi:flagellar hook-basal body complex protein FliE